MEKTIRKVAQHSNYLLYGPTMFIDLIRDSWPFQESCNTLYGHMTPPLPFHQIIDSHKNATYICDIIEMDWEIFLLE